MRIVRTQSEIDSLDADRGELVLVPTMGALHAGHAALIRRGAARAETAIRSDHAACIVSIFVNPTQFDDPRDFARYPRVLDVDVALCEAAGATAVFAPSVETMYPQGMTVAVPPMPAVATEPGLEDAHRPGHFRGVCQVVRRLFEMVRPKAAVFGEKDWQQLQVVRAMTIAEGLPIEIIAGPTVREADGLAMSSRNVFLTAEERLRAAAMHRALRAAQHVGATASESRPGALRAAGTQAIAEDAMRRVLIDAGIEVEYATIRHAHRLVRIPDDDPSPRRALIAGRLGSVRLIDNAAWG